MTVEEKRKTIDRFCYSHAGCVDCPYENDDESWCCRYAIGTIPEEKLDSIIHTFASHKSEEDSTQDMINHPPHYCREGGMESIDEMILVFGKEAVKHFCLCNCWKYRYRSSSKNGDEDLKKSDWYMRKYKELCDNE